MLCKRSSGKGGRRVGEGWLRSGDRAHESGDPGGAEEDSQNDQEERAGHEETAVDALVYRPAVGGDEGADARIPGEVAADVAEVEGENGGNAEVAGETGEIRGA